MSQNHQTWHQRWREKPRKSRLFKSQHSWKKIVKSRRPPLQKKTNMFFTFLRFFGSIFGLFCLAKNVVKTTSSRVSISWFNGFQFPHVTWISLPSKVHHPLFTLQLLGRHISTCEILDLVQWTNFRESSDFKRTHQTTWLRNREVARNSVLGF